MTPIVHRLKQDMPGAEGQQAIAGKGTEWEPVGKGVDPGNRQLTLLRGRDGGWLAVPTEKLAEYFDLCVAASAADDEELEAAIRETMTSARVMSTTRFVILPVFLTGSGLLAGKHAEKSSLACAVAGDKSIVASDAAINASYDLVPFVGLLLALLFAFIEASLSRNLRLYYAAVEDKTRGRPHWWQLLAAHRQHACLGTTRLLLLLPYAFALAYWGVQLNCRFAWESDPAGAAWAAAGLSCLAIVLFWGFANGEFRLCPEAEPE